MTFRFLPYTINFHASEPRRRSSRTSSSLLPPRVPDEIPPASAPLETPTPAGAAAANNEAISLFDQQQGAKTVGLTPGATTEHERIFSSDLNKVNAAQEHAAYPFPPMPTLDEKDSLTESEAHSPAWGATTALNQPRPQAAFAASPSILKHQDTVLPVREAKQPALSNVDAFLAAKRLEHGRAGSFSRADWTIETSEQGNGGLRNAVRSATDAGQLEDKIWVGTLGMPTDALAHQTRATIAERLQEEYGSVTVFVSDADFDGHYTHFCKTILWPVFHYQIPDNPKSKAYEDHSWIYYVKINQAFAERIAKNWKRGDSIWVQDYHLLLVPALLRKLLPDAQIGFFLHIAFPSSEVFRCLAPRKELLEGMLGANLIGFQTDEYCRHFLQTCSRILSVEATNEGLQLEDRFVNVATFPIGIDPTSWDKRRQAADVEQWIRTISDRYQGKRLIVSRDKIDQVRGIRQKLLSYELFLNSYPEWREQVCQFIPGLITLEEVNKIGGVDSSGNEYHGTARAGSHGFRHCDAD